MKKLDKFMDTEVATIWVRAGQSKKHSLNIGGIYREHHQLGTQDMLASAQEQKMAQEYRWDKIIKQWTAAGRSSKCVVIGDTNLDFLKWKQSLHSRWLIW